MTGQPALVVIPCGGKKLPQAAPARRLYVGAYFTACRRAAEALTPTHGWLILSALHGLVAPDTVLQPYNLRMGQPGSVTPARLVQQATDLGVVNLAPVVILAGRDYTRAARAVWPHAITPLAGLGGMGHQMAYLARVRALRRLPTTPPR